MGAFSQHPTDNVDVHFVAVPTNHIITVNIPMTVYEIIYIAVIPLAIYNDIVEIKFSCFGKQCEKFFCHILFSSKMLLMLLPTKKREAILICPSMLIYLIMNFEL